MKTTKKSLIFLLLASFFSSCIVVPHYRHRHPRPPHRHTEVIIEHHR